MTDRGARTPGAVLGTPTMLAAVPLAEIIVEVDERRHRRKVLPEDPSVAESQAWTEERLRGIEDAVATAEGAEPRAAVERARAELLELRALYEQIECRRDKLQELWAEAERVLATLRPLGVFALGVLVRELAGRGYPFEPASNWPGGPPDADGAGAEWKWHWSPTTRDAAVQRADTGADTGSDTDPTRVAPARLARAERELSELETMLPPDRRRQERANALRGLLWDALKLGVAKTDDGLVHIGTRVTLAGCGVPDRTLTIVLPMDADPARAMMSCDAPAGKALICKGVNDRVAIPTPGGAPHEYRIESLEPGCDFPAGYVEEARERCAAARKACLMHKEKAGTG